MTKQSPGDELPAHMVLLAVLRRAFFEYFALGSQEWGPDRDDDTAARTALAVLRRADFLAHGGQIFLVTECHEEREDGGVRRWSVTTKDQGGILDGYAERMD